MLTDKGWALSHISVPRVMSIDTIATHLHSGADGRLLQERHGQESFCGAQSVQVYLSLHARGNRTFMPGDT